MMRGLPIVVRLVVSLALLFAGLFIFRALADSRPEPRRVEAEELLRRVTYIESRPIEIGRQWTGFGTVRAVRTADVPARVTAVVQERPEGIERGAIVTEGTVLVRLDDADIREQITLSRATEAELNARGVEVDAEERLLRERLSILDEQRSLSETELERLRAARQRGAAADREVDAAAQSLNRVRLERAQAQELIDRIPARRDVIIAQRDAELARRRLAEEQLARTVIVAPINGQIQELDVEFGEYVQSGDRIARLVDRSEVEIALQLPASAKMSVRKGDEVRIRGTGRDAAEWTSRIERIAPEFDPATRTMRVYVRLSGDQPLPAPGQFVRGEVQASERALRTVVPRRAILHDRIMMIDDDDRLIGLRVDVDFRIDAALPEFGLPDRDWAVLRTELPAGTRLVPEASRRYFDGMRVQPVRSSTNDLISLPEAAGESDP